MGGKEDAAYTPSLQKSLEIIKSESFSNGNIIDQAMLRLLDFSKSGKILQLLKHLSSKPIRDLYYKKT